MSHGKTYYSLRLETCAHKDVEIQPKSEASAPANTPLPFQVSCTHCGAWWDIGPYRLAELGISTVKLKLNKRMTLNDFKNPNEARRKAISKICHGASEASFSYTIIHPRPVRR